MNRIKLPLDGIEVHEGELLMVLGGFAPLATENPGCGCYAGIGCGCGCRNNGAGCGCGCLNNNGVGCQGGYGCGCNCMPTPIPED